jgi:hypothetical protein
MESRNGNSTMSQVGLVGVRLSSALISSPLLVSGSGLADGLEQSNPRPPQSYSSPLVRQSAIEYPSAAGNQNQEVVTLLLLPLFVFLLTRCLDSYEENGLNGDCTGLLPLL